MNKILKIAALGLAVFTGSPLFAAENYSVDPAHSSINFSVKHMMVSNVTGGFNDFTGALVLDNGVLTSAAATINAASIDTRMEARDQHLRSPDFFDTAKFPTITFTSKKITGKAGFYTLVGNLTIKDVTKEVVIPVSVSGPVKSPGGGEIIGLAGELNINRQEYGVAYNSVLDSGGVAVGNDVAISINLEVKKQ